MDDDILEEFNLLGSNSNFSYSFFFFFSKKKFKMLALFALFFNPHMLPVIVFC